MHKMVTVAIRGAVRHLVLSTPRCQKEATPMATDHTHDHLETETRLHSSELDMIRPPEECCGSRPCPCKPQMRCCPCCPRVGAREHFARVFEYSSRDSCRSKRLARGRSQHSQRSEEFVSRRRVPPHNPAFFSCPAICVVTSAPLMLALTQVRSARGPSA